MTPKLREQAQACVRDQLAPYRGRGALRLDEVEQMIEAAFLAGVNYQLEQWVNHATRELADTQAGRIAAERRVYGR